MTAYALQKAVIHTPVATSTASTGIARSAATTTPFNIYTRPTTPSIGFVIGFGIVAVLFAAVGIYLFMTYKETS